MAALTRAVQISKSVNNATKLFANLSLSSNVATNSNFTVLQRIPPAQCALLHTTSKRNDLMEFFDDPKNWGENQVKVGRSWRKDELRLKSNEDLHKLWYVLLKEHNMLLTMEHACKEAFEIFPNPERIDKVEISMENLEAVVRERNQAYHLLETGEHGERPSRLVYNAIGMRFLYRLRQYPIPIYYNTWWRKRHFLGYRGRAVSKFLSLYREKMWIQRMRAKNREKVHALALLRRFPNMDLEALKQQYPSVDVDKIKHIRRADGHFEPR